MARIKVALFSLSKDFPDLLQHCGQTSNEKSQPQNLLTEANAPSQPVDESKGVDDQLGPGHLHYLIVHQEHLESTSLGVSALMVGLKYHGRISLRVSYIDAHISNGRCDAMPDTGG